MLFCISLFYSEGRNKNLWGLSFTICKLSTQPGQQSSQGPHEPQRCWTREPACRNMNDWRTVTEHTQASSPSSLGTVPTVAPADMPPPPPQHSWTWPGGCFCHLGEPSLWSLFPKQPLSRENIFSLAHHQPLVSKLNTPCHPVSWGRTSSLCLPPSHQEMLPIKQLCGPFWHFTLPLGDT